MLALAITVLVVAEEVLGQTTWECPRWIWVNLASLGMVGLKMPLWKRNAAIDQFCSWRQPRNAAACRACSDRVTPARRTVCSAIQM